MRAILCLTAMIAVCLCTVPAKAGPIPVPEIAATKTKAAPIEVGWPRRYYRRWGYAVPYAYPPTYGYYYPPPAYYTPAYPAYPYHAPYRYYRPYYAPYY